MRGLWFSCASVISSKPAFAESDVQDYQGFADVARDGFLHGVSYHHYLMQKLPGTETGFASTGSDFM